MFQALQSMFDFFPRKFAACSKPPSRDNHRKASYPRTQQRDQGAARLYSLGHATDDFLLYENKTSLGF